MAVDAEFEEACDKIEQMLEKLNQARKALQRAVDTVLRAAGEHIRREVEELIAKIGEVVSGTFQLFTERGSASAIRTAADSWNTGVKARLTAQTAELDLRNTLVTDNRWQGAAAKAYADAASIQNEALTQVATTTDELQNLLHQIASALKTYWVGVAIALGVFLAAVAVAVASAGAAIAAAITAGVAYLAAMAKLSADYANSLDERVSKLEQQITNKPTKKWPPATAQNYNFDDNWQLVTG